MMKSEFEQMVVFNERITDGEYAEIEKAYYGFTGDKREFCETLNALVSNPYLMDLYLQTCYRNSEGTKKEAIWTLRKHDDYINYEYRRKFAFMLTARLQVEFNENCGDFGWYWC